MFEAVANADAETGLASAATAATAATPLFLLFDPLAFPVLLPIPLSAPRLLLLLTLLVVFFDVVATSAVMAL